MATVPSSRALTALVTGVATTAYYAVPDVASSRAARGWLKAACAGVIVAASAPGGREAWQEMRSSWRDASDAPDTSVLDDAEPDADATGSPARAAALAVAGVAVIVGSVVLTVAGERWVFRRGEARAAAGVRFAHTRAALVFGALNAAATYFPDAPGRR
ncbi:hypothetical protein [Cellulomonas sp. S1-8]|uniref:hypothetical protein n=1 Tax=Cellulomonas sp. S1-8 TaxID=2904790 RepID=UPI002243BFA6|nr:hypothetical protein [Cellulomonas sp. S1-8]UZN03425.1 hypothetical protein OKX07_00320 [Cellulomonas sp. S1-8]